MKESGVCEIQINFDRKEGGPQLTRSSFGRIRFSHPHTYEGVPVLPEEWEQMDVFTAAGEEVEQRDRGCGDSTATEEMGITGGTQTRPVQPPGGP